MGYNPSLEVTLYYVIFREIFEFTVYLLKFISNVSLNSINNYPSSADNAIPF